MGSGCPVLVARRPAVAPAEGEIAMLFLHHLVVDGSKVVVSQMIYICARADVLDTYLMGWARAHNKVSQGL